MATGGNSTLLACPAAQSLRSPVSTRACVYVRVRVWGAVHVCAGVPPRNGGKEMCEKLCERKRQMGSDPECCLRLGGQSCGQKVKGQGRGHVKRWRPVSLPHPGNENRAKGEIQWLRTSWSRHVVVCFPPQYQSLTIFRKPWELDLVLD